MQKEGLMSIKLKKDFFNPKSELSNHVYIARIENEEKYFSTKVFTLKILRDDISDLFWQSVKLPSTAFVVFR